MTIDPVPSGHSFSFSQLQQTAMTGGMTGRLLTAALLGGLIGLNRELHHKPSGIRTNLLICCAASLFTFLSPIIAGDGGNNKGQIASNIVQGIGFLGAGLILHNRSRVSGLTSAATVFAVAAIGMACGAGLYVPAVFATATVLAALVGVGFIEKHGNFKLYMRMYEVRGSNGVLLEASILRGMDQEGRRLSDLDRSKIGEIERAIFPVEATTKQHAQLKKTLKEAPGIDEVLSFRSWEDE